MTRRPLCTLALLIVAGLLSFPELVHAQRTATLRGFVVGADDGQALQGVNIAVRDMAGELVSGTATDLDGLYIILNLPAGRYAVVSSYIGYATQTDTLDLAEGEIRTHNIDLTPDTEALDEVLVESERLAGAARVTAGQQAVRPADIELVPSPDVSGDLINYLTTLPGIVSTGDRGGQLFIRGGEPSQNLVLLDGMILYQPFHILGFYSAFPSDVLNQADVYAGGFGSRFWGRLASVIDVQTRNGNKNRFSGVFTAAPFVSSAMVEGPVVPGKLSALVSARQSVIDIVGIDRMLGEDLPYEFGDIFAKVHGVINENNQFSVSGIWTHDRGRLGLPRDGVPPDEIRWSNQGISGRYLVLPRTFPVRAEALFAVSRLTTELGPADAPTRSSTIEGFKASVDISYFGKRLDVNAGLHAQTPLPESQLGGLFQNVRSSRDVVGQVAFYLEPEFTIFNSLRIRPGLLVQHYRSHPFPFYEPRLRMVYTAGKHEISGAAGVYHQEIIGLNDRRDATSIFTVWTAIPSPRDDSRGVDVREGRIPQAIHGILGYRVNPSPQVEFSIEGYYKQLDNLFVSEWTAFPRFTTRLQPAEGTSYGADARLELRLGSFYGYVNYGLSSTRYQAKQASLELWYGTEVLDFRPPHDRRHQINALASYTLGRTELSARWQFGSGLPYSRVLGFDGFILMDGMVDVFETEGNSRVIYEGPYRGILPTYHRLDLSAERKFFVSGAEITIVASVINAYDRSNLFYLDLFTSERVDQLPLVPTVGVKVAV